MGFLQRRINRKTFGISIFLFIVIFTPLYKKLPSLDIRTQFCILLCGVIISFVLVKWRNNDIGNSNLKTIICFIIFGIQPIGMIAAIYLLAAKGKPDDSAKQREENVAEQMARQEQQQFFELVERYRRHLKKGDDSHDAAIAHDFYTFCSGVTRLDKVVRQCHADVSKFQDAYVSMKRENILWAGSDYLPFLAFRNDKALRILLSDPKLQKEESLTQIKHLLKHKRH